MADDIFKWIRNISALNDEQLKQEIDLVHQSSIKSFASALTSLSTPVIIAELEWTGILQTRSSSSSKPALLFVLLFT
jgi:hypothetical protein